MNRPLKDALRGHLETKRLGEAQLQALEALQQRHADRSATSVPAKPSTPPAAARAPGPRCAPRAPWWLPTSLGIAMAGLVAFAILLLGPPRPDPDIAGEIAAEVVRNHIHLKPMEVRGRDLQRLRDYFTELDFVPIESALLAQADLNLEGGRYCSLKGVPAAQLRVRRHGTGPTQTLYQTEYRPEVFKKLPRLEEGEAPRELHVNGVKVRVWVEKGLLFALTGD